VIISYDAAMLALSVGTIVAIIAFGAHWPD